jgi:hypothetical protein
MADLAAQLATVASVRRGLAALETTSATLPVITIWSTGDEVVSPETGRPQRIFVPAEYTRRITLEYKMQATSAYDEALDTALSALRRVLSVAMISDPLLGGYATALRQSPTTFFHPANNGELAVIQIPLEIDYLEYW